MHTFAGLIITVLAMQPLAASAGDTIEWPDGRKVAVALTYDDALASQLDHAVPALNRHGFRGTFYLAVGSNSMLTRMPEWRDVAAQGHELGNHTIYHPCSAQGPDRAWVEPHNDLDHQNVARLRREIEVTNVFLQAIDGETRRSYAATCYDRLAGGEFYWPKVADLFAAMRDLDEGVPPGSKAYWGPTDPETSGADLVRFVTDNSDDGNLIVIVFHGVGGDHLPVTPEAHEELLDFLSANAERYWIDTYLNIIDYVQTRRGGDDTLVR